MNIRHAWAARHCIILQLGPMAPHVEAGSQACNTINPICSDPAALQLDPHAYYTKCAGVLQFKLCSLSYGIPSFERWSALTPQCPPRPAANAKSRSPDILCPGTDHYRHYNYHISLLVTACYFINHSFITKLHGCLNAVQSMIHCVLAAHNMTREHS